MKALIWIVCMAAALVANIIADALLKPFGLRLGWWLRLLLGAAAVFLARRFCLKLDANKIKDKARQANISEVDVVRKEIPSSLLSLCEGHRGNDVALKSLLDDCIKKGMINQAEAMLLLEEYRKE